MENKLNLNKEEKQFLRHLKKTEYLVKNYEFRHLDFISPSGVKVVLVKQLIEKDLWRVYGEVILPVFCDLYKYVDFIASGFEEGLENVSVNVTKIKFNNIIKINLPTVKGQLLDNNFYFSEEEKEIISKIDNTIATLDNCIVK